jgi:N-acetylglucosamine malate deacetylase 1
LKLDALFFGAHPDDVEITCGGTVINLVKAGMKTGIADLTEGELSTRGNFKTRKAETLKASTILGINVRENLGFEDGKIQNFSGNRLNIIGLLRKYRPSIVFAPYPNDRHPDHINASNLIRESVFYSGLKKIELENLEPHRPSKIFYYRHNNDIPISFIVDISGTFESKLNSIKAYKSQFYNKKSKEPETFISSKLFIEEIETRAKFFGFKIGVKYGEPFWCAESIKLNAKSLFEI